VSTPLDRHAQLEQYGRTYARERLAVTWTDGLVGDAAKRVTTRGWPQTTPLPSADGGAFGAALFAGRGLLRNPAVVVRASRLIVVESDSIEGLTQIEALALPPTWTVRSSAPHRQHRYLRWPDRVTPEFVSFRFEPAGIVADREHYYLPPPALHPSGSVYSFLPALGPNELSIATLPEDCYLELVELARRGRDQREATTQAAAVVEAARDESDEDAERHWLDDVVYRRRAAAYGQAVLDDQCEKIRAAPVGTRHTTINRAAYVVGGYLESAQLDREDVEKLLQAAARVAFDGYSNGQSPAGPSPDERQTVRTISRGLDAGAAKPRAIPERVA